MQKIGACGDEVGFVATSAFIGVASSNLRLIFAKGTAGMSISSQIWNVAPSMQGCWIVESQSNWARHYAAADGRPRRCLSIVAMT